MNNDLNTDLSWLDQYQHPAGGVAYLPGRQPRIEPTTIAILAGVARPEDFAWLRAQLPQYLFNDPLPLANLAKSPYPADDRPWVVAAGILALCNDQSLNLAACAKYLKKNHAIDADAEGLTETLDELELAGALPWNTGNYGWVQPTCWGLFAELALLAIATNKNEQERLLSNLAARIDFLLSRKTADHGWNYGNTIVFGIELSAHPVETAMVLAALAGIKNSRIASYLLFLKFDPAPSFETLERLIQNEGSRLTRSWQQIARSSWQKDTNAANDISQGPPTIGESSIDALLAHIASRPNAKQGFHFLQPSRKP
ncbi:MAG: hypothetical protein GXP26_13035 [Planctomycetes bacterium]|nr:hypothetical protein [Planctomycetota bacterium]